MFNDQFNTGISATTYTPAWDILPDLGNATGRRSSPWPDNSVHLHFDEPLQKNSLSEF
jgi:hypothetical protein